MAQIFYIDSDEEIIGAIGRLRHSEEQENYFVFPKRALILQSIINLRLFQKEAQKMNKTVIVVTQDEVGRMLAEKAGIRTEAYSDEFTEKANHFELRPEAMPPEAALVMEEKADALLEKEVSQPKAEAIGSNSFFSGAKEPSVNVPAGTPAAPPTPVPAPKPVQQLRIRNVTPERPPGLNSVRTEEREAEKRPPQPQQVTSDITPPRPVQSFPEASSRVETPAPPYAAPITSAPPTTGGPAFYPQTATMRPTPQPVPRPAINPQPQPQPPSGPLAAPRPSAEKIPQEKKAVLKQFFARASETAAAKPTPTKIVMTPKVSSKKQEKSSQSVPPKKTPSPAIHGSAKTLFYLFAVITLLSVGLLLAYLFFPKVTVKITPFTTEEKIESTLRGVTSGGDSLDTTPVRLLEREIPIKVTGTATDTSASTTEKAQGTITITNDFGTEAQSLVATTRFETPDGKIFRLVKSITVPGKSGTTPGSIEADVVADQPGDGYNIEPTTFTIPGFKGNPKFEKITAKSTKKMLGGGTGGSEIKSIARADLDKAEADAKTKAEEAFASDIESSRVPGELFLKESLELTPLDTGTRPREGTKGETFEYERTFKAKAFLLQENLLKQKVEAATQKETNGIRLEVAKIDIDYGEIAPHFEDGTVSIKIHALVHKKALLDNEGIKTKLLGRNAEGIQAFLAENPSIQKIELDFKPKWFGTSIPKTMSRVEINILEQ